MIIENFKKEKRSNRTVNIIADFVVIGGGLSGVCAAITAARKGVKTILVQDRPVLGGNASSEVRLWALGATSHMGNNNRWSREGGIIDEIMVENVYRNKEGNPIIFDTVLLEKVSNEKNITLLLNTAVFSIEKTDAKNIKSIQAFNSQNSTNYTISAPLFCDASGDGIVAFQAGASFRIGAESKEEFGELFAPDKSYGQLLGHSMFFYTKEVDHPVKYVAPSYALKDITQIPRHKIIRKDMTGCNFWWFEYGGRLDTIHETEEIKWELSKVIFGVWDYIKNSGEFEGVENLTLEWVGNVPGKRESRRFEGLYMMKQQDILEQQSFDDAIAYGGWALDLHPADGIYSELSGCTQWHSKGVYDIPYRSFVSKDIDNLFLAGRIISSSHVAFGSTRVMVTCGFGAQAVGMAASICKEDNLLPAQILENGKIRKLQNELNCTGQSILNVPIDSASNLVNQANISASSSVKLSEITANGNWLKLDVSAAQLLPLKANQKYGFKVEIKAVESTQLEVQLRRSEIASNYTPEIILESQTITVDKGIQTVAFTFNASVEEDLYGFITFMANKKVSIRESKTLMSGVMTVFNGVNEKVSNDGSQRPPKGIGVDEFEFWIPNRRPQGKNIAMEISPAIEAFEVKNIGNGYTRPWLSANAWVADLADDKPSLRIEWDEVKSISEIKLFFDTDFDHAMETVQFGHPEDVMPFCVQDYTISTLEEEVIKKVSGNYQTINSIKLDTEVKTQGLVIEVQHPSDNVPAAIFEVLIG
ncbi:FAD-dependent oxidoreductase [Labilibaculum sp. DW002]|uniref:FAD-dependent oxidoreductase n=1 Tax=Paralabilibaculum antarcticum TaxID=2912572 RepID=A0ABT5VPS3_9BACT|nr:FAD-dependent oxidoreductase [Labilibaculum sp. DW002]MDE5417428.1 FAD-dependent oxidoreductase [Labilibaculum sp. DW002]